MKLGKHHNRAVSRELVINFYQHTTSWNLFEVSFLLVQRILLALGDWMAVLREN